MYYYIDCNSKPLKIWIIDIPISTSDNYSLGLYILLMQTYIFTIITEATANHFIPLPHAA